MYDKLHRFTWEDGLLAAGLALIVVGVGYNVTAKFNQEKVTLIKAGVTPTVSQVNSKVTFDISGEVIKPGVYRLAKGCRISEAMSVAGGLAANADREWIDKNINRAKIIADGEKIYIPKKITNNQNTISKQVPITNNQITNKVLGIEIININTAGVNELDKLEGVGPAIAQRIIDYRDKNGGFKDINELKMVQGIGDKMFEKIKEKIGI